MSLRRRSVCLLIGTALGGLAGCSQATRDDPMVTIELSNATDNQRDVFLEVLPTDVDRDMSENMLFERQITLGPTGTDTATRELSDIFESEKALIRVENEIGTIGEYTFVPDCPRGASVEEAVRIYVTGIDGVAFAQNTCG